MEIPKNVTVLLDGTLHEALSQMDILHAKSDYYKDRRIAILETAPQIRTIKLVDNSSELRRISLFEGEKKFYLAFPYMQFIFTRGRFAVAFKNKPGDPFGQLILPSLPNIYPEGRVCLGSQRV